MLDTSERQVEADDSMNSPIKKTKMSSSLSRLSLEIPRITATASAGMPNSSREERNGLYSVRNRNRNDRTSSSLGQTSQDVVHVAIRLKPPVPHSDSSNTLQFCIETAPLATPRTGRRGEGTPRCGVSHIVKNSEEESCNGGTNTSSSSRPRDDGRSTSNSNGFLTSTVGIPISSLGQGSTQQISLTPRVGVNTSSKLLTIMFPTADGTKDMQRTYEFDEVISPTVTDAEICDAMIPGIIEQLKAGFNACVLCYGQTGSGKTHTINAVIPAFIKALFDNLNDTDDIVEVSYIQIYNNNAYNLLGEGRSEHGVLLQKPKGALVREPRYLVRSVADVQKRITEAQRKRFVGSHLLNSRSSRSHTILSFHVTRCVGGIPVSTNRLTLGDLAGSERVKKTGVAGDELEEAIAINKSLSVLHAVIKATAEDADVLPVRESILTLYLAASLSGCYLLLIATVSLEKQNFAETKSSLDFAMTAKRCVVTKSKGKPRDFLVSGACSFEETYRNLMKEIETLRNRVCTLQEEVYIEKQRSAIIQQKGISDNVNETKDNETTPNQRGEDAKMREHVIALERQCALLQDLLRERERELSSLESRGDIAEEERKELEQRAQEREEARQTLEEVAPQLGTSELLQKLTDTFLSLQEQFDIMYQQKQVMAKAMESVRSEQQRTMVDLLEARKELVQTETKQEEMRQRMEEAISESKNLKERLEELNLKLLREYVERAVQEDTVAWFKASGEREEECERLRCDLEEQRNLYDVVQNRLTITEHELDRSNKLHGEVLQEMRKKDDAFRTIWLLLTPQQKARFMSVGYSGDGVGDSSSASLHQGHENVQLRSQVRTLRRQLEEELSRNRERDYLIQDLENKNNLLQSSLQECKEAYNSLLSLDEDNRAERQQMEQQLAHLYTYIEESNAKRFAFENQLREAHAEWEKLDEQYRHSKREVVDLTAQLEKAHDEIRIRTGGGDDLNLNSHTNSNCHTNTNTNTNGSRRQPLSTDRRRQQEGTTHSHHSEGSRRRALHRSPELLRKVQLQRVDLAKFARGTALQSALHSSRVHRQRRGVSQHRQLPSLSSLSLDGNSRIPYHDSNGMHHNSSGRTSHRRRTQSQKNIRDALKRSAVIRANSAVAEIPNYIIDKTRRRNS